MTEPHSKSLDDVIAIYLEALDTGQAVDPESFIAKYPQHRGGFLEFVAQNGLLEEIVHPASNAGAGTSPLTHEVPRKLDRLGEFQVRRPLGRGGMGVIYEAYRTSDGEPVALKVLHLHAALDPAYQRRFDRESRAIGSLQHRHIVPLLAAGRDGGISYLAMKLIDGVTLADIVVDQRRRQSDSEAESCKDNELTEGDARTPLTLRSAHDCLVAAQGERDYFGCVAELMAIGADALECAHQAKIVHRDVKPSNLLLDVNGSLWLTDFGLADSDEDLTVTMSGDILGTPAYMSPEQASGIRDRIDHRTDVYALGATLYELATLQRPFQGQRHRVLQDVTRGLLTPPTRRRQDVPRALEAIILKAMAPARSDRYESAAAMAHDLRRFASGRTVEARHPSVAERLVRWTLRNPRTTMAAIVGSLAAVLLIIGIQFGYGRRLATVNRELEQSNVVLEATNNALSASNLDLTRSRLQIRQNLYVADLAAAYRAYHQRDVDTVREFLARHLPADGEPDLRRFEWHLLDRLTQPPRAISVSAHRGEAHELALLPGQDEFLSVGEDGFVRRWDLEEVRSLGQLPFDTQLNAIAVSSAGDGILVGCNVAAGDNPVLLVDLATGEERLRLTPQPSSVESAAIAPDGKFLATAERYGDVLVHNADGELLHRLTTGSRNESLAFGPQSESLYAIVRFVDELGEGRSLVRQWTVPEFAPRLDIGAGSDPVVFAVLPNGNHIAVAGPTQVAIHDTRTGAERWFTRDIRGRIRDVAVSPDGRLLAACCDNGLLYYWPLFDVPLASAELGESPRSLPQPFAIVTGERGLTCVRVKDENRIVTTTQDGTITLWDLQGSRAMRELPVPGLLSATPTTDNPDELIIAKFDGSVVRSNFVTGQTSTVGTFSKKAQGALAMPRNGQSVVASVEGRLAVMNLADQVVQLYAQGGSEDGQCHDLSFTADDRYLYVTHTTRIQVCDAMTWQVVREREFSDLNLRDAKLSPTEEILAVSSYEVLLLLNAQDLTTLSTLPSRGTKYGELCFSDDGRLLAASTDDGNIELLRIPEMERLGVFRGHRQGVYSILFAADNQRIISKSFDRSIRFWDVPTCRLLGMLESTQDGSGLIYQPDRNILISPSHSRGIRVWDFSDRSGNTGNTEVAASVKDS